MQHFYGESALTLEALQRMQGKLLDLEDEATYAHILDEARMAADREVIQATLLRTRFNIARAAQELSVSRMTLYRLMEKYDIRRDNL